MRLLHSAKLLKQLIKYLFSENTLIHAALLQGLHDHFSEWQVPDFQGLVKNDWEVPILATGSASP